MSLLLRRRWPPLAALLLLTALVCLALAAASSPDLDHGLRLEGARASLGSALDAYTTGTRSSHGSAAASGSALDRAPFADKVWHGTTTCAFVFDHGVLVAVDSRASMGACVM